MLRFPLKRSVLAGIAAVSICAGILFAAVPPVGGGHGCVAGCRDLGVGQVWTECVAGRLMKHTCMLGACYVCNDEDCNYWIEGVWASDRLNWMCE